MTRLLFILLLTYAPACFAETIIEAGIHMGGGELIIENYSNGAKDSSDAGDLFSFALGGTKSLTDNLEAQLTFGIKSNIISTSEPEVTWVRYPLNATLFYRGERYRLGVGLTSHFSPKLKGNGMASNVSESFKDALGGILEINFTVDKHFLWGFRYTNITYESDRRDRSVNGNSLGLLIIGRL